MLTVAGCLLVLFFYCEPGCMEYGLTRSMAAPGTLVWMKRTMSIIIVVGAIIKTCKHHHNSFIANQVVWSMAAPVWAIHPLYGSPGPYQSASLSSPSSSILTSCHKQWKRKQRLDGCENQNRNFTNL